MREVGGRGEAGILTAQYAAFSGIRARPPSRYSLVILELGDFAPKSRREEVAAEVASQTR